ncbi:hypothetical protein CVU76_02995 [Candidatus Dojkabacteria bacterium HGW-Dojkabacteria-1]|uniref:Uncharacterized protein n=1 Tax=Candidatus Dojkabacteria bacterium HGW-Dojkabacteria-1 TaxID=2013761 RepID=A0A2N2F473_9BACT|nr:MAG: hypothetical protein CVU76_02995 [Candidatus Dojkabacteria bacterium HGW-Dojkabacteria-1]
MNNETTQPQVAKEEVKVVPTPTTPPPPPSPQPDISEGFNLIPSMSEEEKVVEKTKSRVSIGSVVSLIILVVVILVIVGFNIISRQILNVKKAELFRIENKITQQEDTLISNDEIVDRAVLYTNVRNGAFSHKEIIEFLSRMGTKIGDIQMRSVMISENLDFTYSGYSVSLEQVSKLWYLLGTDENIERINLQSVGKGDNRVTFSFEGKLNGKNFFNK